MAKKIDISGLKPEELEDLIIGLLETSFSLNKLESGIAYTRIHDDHDGTYEGELQVSIDRMGDVFMSTDKHRGPPLRFRSYSGGGRSLRVNAALRIMALAIMLDEKEKPDQPPEQE